MEENELVVCPFVPFHLLRKEKLALHLIKCRNSLPKNSPYYHRAWNMRVCKYNSTHYVDKENLEMHYAVCEFSKKRQEQDIYTGLKFEWENDIGKEISNNPEEDWDKDEPVESYDPMKKINNNPNILFNPIGLTKSQRKEFCTNRKLKANGFNVNEEYKPLRRPFV